MRFDLYREEVRSVEPSPRVYERVRAALDESQATEMTPASKAPVRRGRVLVAACLALSLITIVSSWGLPTLNHGGGSTAYASPLRLENPFIPLDKNCSILIDADRGVAYAALRIDLSCLGSESSYEVRVRGAGLSFLPRESHLGDPTYTVLNLSKGDDALAYLVVEAQLRSDEGETLDEPMREGILADALDNLRGGEIALAAEGRAPVIYRIQDVGASSSPLSLNGRDRIALTLVNFPDSETIARPSV